MSSYMYTSFDLMNNVLVIQDINNLGEFRSPRVVSDGAQHDGKDSVFYKNCTFTNCAIVLNKDTLFQGCRIINCTLKVNEASSSAGKLLNVFFENSVLYRAYRLGNAINEIRIDDCFLQDCTELWYMDSLKEDFIASNCTFVDNCFYASLSEVKLYFNQCRFIGTIMFYGTVDEKHIFNDCYFANDPDFVLEGEDIEFLKFIDCNLIVTQDYEVPYYFFTFTDENAGSVQSFTKSIQPMTITQMYHYIHKMEDDMFGGMAVFSKERAYLRELVNQLSHLKRLVEWNRANKIGCNIGVLNLGLLTVSNAKF